MRRPFVVLFIFLLAGILLGFNSELKLSSVLIIVIILLSIMLFLVLESNQLFVICFATAAFGLFLFNLHNLQDSLSLYSWEDLNLKIELLSSPMQRGYYHEAEAKIISQRNAMGDALIEKKVLLQLRGKGDAEKELLIGANIELQGANVVKNLMDDYGTGYDKYLRSKGYKYVIRGSISSIIFQEEYRAGVLKGISAAGYIRKVNVEGFFDAGLASKESALMKSVLFGNQGYMEEEHLDFFSKSGTAHIIAVSGLHVGILVILLEKLLTLLGIGKNKRLLVTLLFIYFYAYIVGFPVSIIRASSMYLLTIIAYFTNRRYDAINSLMLIAIVVIGLNPFMIYSISFQMSFGATLSILWLYPEISRLLKGLPRGLASLIAVTLAAQFGTLPITAYYFKQISIIAPITNLLIVPSLCLVLSLGLLGGIFSLAWIKPAKFFLIPLNYILKYIHFIVEKTSSIKFASIEVAEVGLLHIVIYYLMLYSVYIIYKKRVSIIIYVRKLGEHELSANNRGYKG